MVTRQTLCVAALSMLTHGYTGTHGYRAGPYLPTLTRTRAGIYPHPLRVYPTRAMPYAEVEPRAGAGRGCVRDEQSLFHTVESAVLLVPVK